ncbi:MAG: hypothetical protein M1568_04705 [Acidobacteria bacterium]|jgi:hypothetical protein|nr:hypothetical protein [Acidobacteriota bacterium]
MFEQAVLPVQNVQAYSEVAGAVELAFASGRVDNFLRDVQRSGVRIRQFEAVLALGLLGRGMAAKYGALGDSDRGLIRELYLRLVERVPTALRAKYLRIYAYY